MCIILDELLLVRLKAPVQQHRDASWTGDTDVESKQSKEANVTSKKTAKSDAAGSTRPSRKQLSLQVNGPDDRTAPVFRP